MATVLAVWLAAAPAWGHTFPPVRTIVVQVERCQLVLLVGYRPGSGEPPRGEIDAQRAILARVASQPKSQMLEAMRRVMTAYAMAPISVTVGGKPLVPTGVRAKIGLEPGGARPIVVALVTFSVPAAGQLAVTSRDPRTTQISWQDLDSGRVDLQAAPAQGTWFVGVASFLLGLAAGDTACATSSTSGSLH